MVALRKRFFSVQCSLVDEIRLYVWLDHRQQNQLLRPAKCISACPFSCHFSMCQLKFCFISFRRWNDLSCSLPLDVTKILFIIKAVAFSKMSSPRRLTFFQQIKDQNKNSKLKILCENAPLILFSYYNLTCISDAEWDSTVINAVKCHRWLNCTHGLFDIASQMMWACNFCAWYQR